MAASRELKILLNNRRTVAALERQYELAFKRVLRQLRAGMAMPGSARVQALVAEISRILLRLQPKSKSPVRTWVRSQLARAYVLGGSAATRQLRADLLNAQAGHLNISRTWTAINQNSLGSVVAATEAMLQGAVEDMKRILGTAIRRTQVTLLQAVQIRDATVSGIIRGATGRQVSDDIASILLKGKVSPAVKRRLAGIGFRADMFQEFERIARGQIITVGKVRMNVRHYSNLVARTQMREAHKVATITRLQQNDIDHVQVSDHVQDEADECTPFAGNVYFIGDGDDPAGFPSLRDSVNGGPPFHPACEHVLEPYVIAFKTEQAVERDLTDAKALPRRFFGKGANEVRKLVKGTPAGELKKIAPRGVADLKKEAA
ncbi:MAG: hypothetical protein LN413_00045 [Candidatus Thermoplasmatota archaeon]|nr:hypothetical protein [Candidatus Thermoplasmatota archaeon]